MASAIGSGKNPTYVDANGRAVASTETVGSDTKPVYMEGGVLKETSKLAPLASPTFTGAPKAPTPTDDSDDKQVVNKEYLLDKIGGVSTLSLKDVYPVGSVYITMNADVPAAFRVGMTWVKLTEGRCLWNATNDQLLEGDLEAGLPAVTGTVSGLSCRSAGKHRHEIALANLDTYQGAGSGNYTQPIHIGLDYTGYEGEHTHDITGTINITGTGIYGKSTTVRPPSIPVTMWKRTA